MIHAFQNEYFPNLAFDLLDAAVDTTDQLPDAVSRAVKSLDESYAEWAHWLNEANLRKLLIFVSECVDFVKCQRIAFLKPLFSNSLYKFGGSYGPNV